MASCSSSFHSLLPKCLASVAEIPHPTCFGLESSSVESSTPSHMSSNVPIISMHDASIIYAEDFSSTSVVSTPVVMPHPSLVPMLTHPASSVSCSHTTTTSPPTPPPYPFYFNNFPPIHNSHPSLPLYGPNGSIFRPLPSTSRSLHGYSQFKVGSSSSVPPRQTHIGKIL